MKHIINNSILNSTKEELSSFMLKLHDLDTNKALSKQSTKDFIAFLSKKLMFLKYLYHEENNYSLAVLISDFFFLIISIIKNEIRYIYLNERSIIENFTRYIMKKTLEDSQVTHSLFEEMNNIFFKNTKFQSEFSLIKSEYNIACNYVHGGKKLEHSLISVLDEYINNKLELKNSKALYNNMSRIITTFIRIIISNNTDTVNVCFYRKKTILKYLIGN